ncbi:MAG: ABC transporter ATP-binding protein [Myxococcales bacterium]|nr:ABC transporter ATP-binding protein [Myxococcales bacterium]
MASEVTPGPSPAAASATVPAPATAPVLQLSQICKDFGEGDLVTHVLKQVDVTVYPGELVAIIGPSGSGKSTLLNIIGLLMSPTSGTLRLGGDDVSQLDDGALTKLRGERIGFIFQSHHLLGGLTAAQNLMLPLMIERGRETPEMRALALATLADVGLAHKADALPSRMSGGEQQRVAVARALVKHPPLVLADEPTGNLDTDNAERVFALMEQYNQQRGTAFVIVTHDPRIAARCQRTIEVIDGRARSLR